MNKRSFLKSLLTLAVAPQIILSTSADRFKWKKTGDLWIINPEWVNAPYEVSFICSVRASHDLIKQIEEKYLPYRYDENMKLIPTHILA